MIIFSDYLGDSRHCSAMSSMIAGLRKTRGVSADKGIGRTLDEISIVVQRPVTIGSNDRPNKLACNHVVFLQHFVKYIAHLSRHISKTAENMF